MLNYRLVTILTFSFCVIAPLAAGWASLPDASWYRPYVIWLLFILAVMLWQRRNKT